MELHSGISYIAFTNLPSNFNCMNEKFNFPWNKSSIKVGPIVGLLQSNTLIEDV